MSRDLITSFWSQVAHFRDGRIFRVLLQVRWSVVERCVRGVATEVKTRQTEVFRNHINNAVILKFVKPTKILSSLLIQGIQLKPYMFNCFPRLSFHFF